MLLQTLQALREVRWVSDHQGTSSLLHSAQIEHGFVGKEKKSLPEKLYRAKQVHGTAMVLGHTCQVGSEPSADGLYAVAARPAAISVRTADCVPVLLATADGAFIAAIHGGWRGLAAGILRAAIAVAEAQAVSPKNLIAAIGPAISWRAFEVGEDVLAAFRNPSGLLTDTQFLTSLSKGQRDRWHMDLQQVAVWQLTNLGVQPTNIEVLQTCTYSDGGWNSYRREGKGVGSNISWIANTK